MLGGSCRTSKDNKARKGRGTYADIIIYKIFIIEFAHKMLGVTQAVSATQLGKYLLEAARYSLDKI